MKILITSGGTKIPIDRVRDITNMSHGTFGAKIAREALAKGHDVYFLHAKGSQTPLAKTVEFNYERNSYEHLIDCIEFLHFCEQHSHRFNFCTFRNFDEYQSHFERLLLCEFDIVILAAAVSDYGVANYVDAKIRSSSGEQSIQLKPLPKLIGRARELAPDSTLVGFKLLVDSELPELMSAAFDSIHKNKCDMIVANDLRDLQAGNHTVHFVFRDNRVLTFESDPDDPYFLAGKVIEHAESLRATRSSE